MRRQLAGEEVGYVAVFASKLFWFLLHNSRWFLLNQGNILNIGHHWLPLDQGNILLLF
jgi:hypothetical protein